MSLSVGASLASALRQHYPQRLLVEQVQKKLQAALKQSLSPSRAAELGGAGGPGASGFLQYPTDANCSMENTFWSAALRQRLGLPKAELSQQQLATAPRLCCCQNGRGANL